MWVQFLGQEDSLEEEMASHSSILAWKIPWTEVPGRLQSMGSPSWMQLSKWAHKHKYKLGKNSFCLFVCLFRNQSQGYAGSTCYDQLSDTHEKAKDSVPFVLHMVFLLITINTWFKTPYFYPYQLALCKAFWVSSKEMFPCSLLAMLWETIIK